MRLGGGGGLNHRMTAVCCAQTDKHNMAASKVSTSMSGMLELHGRQPLPERPVTGLYLCQLSLASHLLACLSLQQLCFNILQLLHGLLDASKQRAAPLDGACHWRHVPCQRWCILPAPGIH